MKNIILFTMLCSSFSAFSQERNLEGTCARVASDSGLAAAAVRYGPELSATTEIISQKWANGSEELQQVWTVYILARNEDPRLVTTVTVETSLRRGGFCEVRAIFPLAMAPNSP